MWLKITKASSYLSYKRSSYGLVIQSKIKLLILMKSWWILIMENFSCNGNDKLRTKLKEKKKWQCFKHPPAIFSLKPYAGGGYAGYDGLANPDCPWLGFTAIPKSPGTLGANAVGGGKGWTPAPGTWPSSVLGPGTFVPKATGNAGCPGRGG